MATTPLPVVVKLEGQAGLTATGVGPWQVKPQGDCAVQVTITGTGALSGTILVEVAHGTVDPVPLETPAAVVTLSGATKISDGFLMTGAPWRFIRLNVLALSGTGATVTGLVGA